MNKYRITYCSAGYFIEKQFPFWFFYSWGTIKRYNKGYSSIVYFNTRKEAETFLKTFIQEELKQQNEPVRYYNEEGKLIE